MTADRLGTKDGLLSVEANGGRQPAGWKTADGRLWFPTMGGVAIVDPSAVLINAHPPAAVIEELQVSGQPADFTTAVTVPANASTLAIRYTAPSFIKPEVIRFRYRLDGLDDEWIEAETRAPPRITGFRRANMSSRSLPRTVTESGIPRAKRPIVVLPPFWRTWWFVALSPRPCWRSR